MKELPERIRAARQTAGLSQEAVAAAVGYRREWVTKFERGRIHSPELAYRLARELGVSATLDEVFAAPPGDTP